MFDRDEILKALTELRDAVGPRLGQAVNRADEVIDKAPRIQRENAYGDQSKW